MSPSSQVPTAVKPDASATGDSSFRPSCKKHNKKNKQEKRYTQKMRIYDLFRREQYKLNQQDIPYFSNNGFSDSSTSVFSTSMRKLQRFI